MVRAQVSLIDSEEFYTCWQPLLPLSNKTRPHVIWEQLLSKLPWIKEKVVKKRPRTARVVLWLILVALTLSWLPLHSKRNSGNIALNLAPRFPRWFPLRGRG